MATVPGRFPKNLVQRPEKEPDEAGSENGLGTAELRIQKDLGDKDSQEER